MKHLLTCLLLTLILSPSSLSAQSTFFASYSGPVDPGGWKDIVATSDQGFAMIQAGYYDAAILKVDANMNPVWSYNIDSLVSTSDIIETNDNHLVMAGVEGTQNSQIALLKFDLAGNLVWKKSVSYNPVNIALLRAFKIIPAYDNGFLILGGECVGENIVIRMDKDGNVLWSKQFANTTHAGTATIYNGTQIGNNQYMMITTDRTLSVYLIDDNGNMVSHHHYDNGNAQGYAKHIFQTPNGNYMVLGGLGNTDGWRDVWMTMLSPSGYLLWMKTASSSTLDTEEVSGYRLDGNNGMTLLHPASRPVGTNPVPRFNYLLVSQFDLSGNFISAQKALPPSSNYAGIGYEGSAVQNGGLYGVGWGGVAGDDNFVNLIDANGNGLCSPSSTTMTVSDITSTIQSLPDNVSVSNVPVTVLPLPWDLTQTSFTMNVNCGNIPTAVEEPVTDLWHVAPHPAEGETWLHHPAVEAGMIQVFDASGRVVLSQELTEGSSQTHLLTTNLAAGLYLLRAETGGEVHVERLLVR